MVKSLRPVRMILSAMVVVLGVSTAASAAYGMLPSTSHAERWSTYYQTHGPAFTDAEGLTALGEVAKLWMSDAEVLGVDGLDERSRRLQFLLEQWSGQLWGWEHSAMRAALVLKAWQNDLPDPMAEELRASVELILAVSLLDLAAAITHHPRIVDILRDDKGRYGSPDPQWEAGVDALPEGRLNAIVRLVDRRDAAGLDEMLIAAQPGAEQYQRLLKAARRYRAICDSGGWGELKVPRYRRSSRWQNTDRINALQARLIVEGFLEGQTGTYDEETFAAVKTYQAARQLRATGAFDAATAKALNIPCERRLSTLLLNIKRWRHTARTDEKAFVEVNLASQEVRYVFDGLEKLRKRAIVGKGRWFWSRSDKRRIAPKKSPILTDSIEKVYINPSWTIPSSIVRGEILPRLEKNPDYMEKMGYQTRKSSSGYTVYYQPPGPNNTLGEVKLGFPNAESIYLHDTNNRYAFRHTVRDLSHGCIRVQDALEFATAIVSDDHQRLDKHFHPRTLYRLSRKEGTYWFSLEPHLPVFLEYYTASVSQDGVVRFHPDVYEYDLEARIGRPLPRRL